jgi:hypothetical protein
MVNGKWWLSVIRDERSPLDARDVQPLLTIYHLPFTGSQFDL